MSRWVAVLFMATMLTGCLSRQIREEARLTLECKGPIQLEENKEHEVWRAVGCGKEAICSLPEVEGAEVRCEGGGPRLTRVSVR